VTRTSDTLPDTIGATFVYSAFGRPAGGDNVNPCLGIEPAGYWWPGPYVGDPVEGETAGEYDERGGQAAGIVPSWVWTLGALPVEPLPPCYTDPIGGWWVAPAP
jgi:hypothetical protein